MTVSRRKFLQSSSAAMAGMPLLPLVAVYPIQDKFFNISLAQWSLHRALEATEVNASEFAVIAKNNYDINAVEYVNGFYRDTADNQQFWIDMNKRANNVGVKNLLIMVDDEGDLGNPNETDRQAAIENHYKWVNAAAIMNCHSIRINAFGDGSKDVVKEAIVDGLGRLCEYAATSNINVLIENHGLYSSDADWVVDVMKQVDMDNCGTLPDFGNFCLTKKWGSTKENCLSAYDRYEGVQKMLPYAKGVSAKTYDFDDDSGEENLIDFQRMLNVVKDGGFNGYVGIEYEGNRLSEPDGIRATKKLLERYGGR